MNNFEVWIEGLIQNLKDVPIPCEKCPAKKYCESDEAQDHDCAEIFKEWSNKEYEK